MTFTVTHHAVSRYRLHHPGANREQLLHALQHTVEIAQAIALQLAGRNPIRETSSRYLLSHDREGMFVVEKDEDLDVVITYLRFGQLEREFTMRHWPPTKLPPKEEKVNIQAGPGPLKKRLDENIECIHAPASAVVISEKMRLVFGSQNKARVSLVDAQLIKELPDYLILLAGPVRVHLKYEDYRWRASLEEESKA